MYQLRSICEIFNLAPHSFYHGHLFYALISGQVNCLSLFHFSRFHPPLPQNSLEFLSLDFCFWMSFAVTSGSLTKGLH